MDELLITPCGCLVRKKPGAHRHVCLGPCYVVRVCDWHRAMAREAAILFRPRPAPAVAITPTR